VILQKTQVKKFKYSATQFWNLIYICLLYQWILCWGFHHWRESLCAW